MSNLSKETIKNYMMDFEIAMTELEKKYGIKSTHKSVTYTKNSFTFKISATQLITENGSLLEPTMTESYWIKTTEFTGMPKLKTAFGRIINEHYKVIGINPNARKNKVLLECTKSHKQYTTSFIILNHSL